MKIIAIDIGGTEIKYGVTSSSGDILFSNSTSTEASKGIDSLLEKIYSITDSLNYYHPAGIAISATGQIDNSKGKVIGGTNIIPGWIGTELADILNKKYNLPVILENDVNCAALGEMWLGAGKDKNNFLCLTIGTGIGGGIVLNKSLLRGEGFVAGEFGHMKIKENMTFQEGASTTALLKMVHDETGLTMNGKEFFYKIHKNEDIYINIFNKWVENFTDGLSSLIYIFNPSLIIIGGGVSKQGDFLLNTFKNSLSNKVMKNYLDILEIKIAEKENSAGMLGATYLLLEKLKEN